MNDEWIEEFKDYNEEVDSRKAERPECPGSDDGMHAMISYESLGYKKCAICGYNENIYTRI